MSFIKKSVLPPTVKEGEFLKAKISNIVYPVESKYKDDQGQNKQQIKFELILASGYRTNCWIWYYENPAEKSMLGTLSLSYMKLVGKQFDSVKEVLESIKDSGQVFIRCTGFREYNGQQYPKFKVVTDKLPPIQQGIQETTQKQNAAVSQVNLDSLSPELRKKVEAELNR